MDNRGIIIILLTIILVAVIAVGTYFYLSAPSEIEYQNINLTSTCSIDIPVSNNITNKTLADNVFTLNDTEHNVFIAYYNSGNATMSSAFTDGTQLAALRDSYKLNAEQITIANETVWYNEKTGEYMAFLGNDNTHDNVLIVTKDNETLAHILSSVAYAAVASSDDEGNSLSISPKNNTDDDKDTEELDYIDDDYEDSSDYYSDDYDDYSSYNSANSYGGSASGDSYSSSSGSVSSGGESGYSDDDY